MRIILHTTILCFLFIHSLALTAQTHSHKAVVKYYNVGNNNSIISTDMLLSFLRDTTNKIYDFNFTNGQEKVLNKIERLRILYGVPSSEALIPWEAGKDYSGEKYLYRFFYFNEDVYQKSSSDVFFSANPSDSSLANGFLYEKIRLRTKLIDLHIPLHISILYNYDSSSSIHTPYLIHFHKAADTRWRIDIGSSDFNIKWNDFINYLTNHYPNIVVYYNPIYKALTDRYPYLYDTYSYRDVCDLPCELVYNKNKIDSIRFYEEIFNSTKSYTKNYKLYKTFSYDSLHEFLIANYKATDFLLPLPEMWKQHQALFVPDSIKTLSFNKNIEYVPQVHKKSENTITATILFSENVNIVCSNNSRLFLGEQSFKSLLLEYIQNNKITVYSVKENYYNTKDTPTPAQIDIEKIYHVCEYFPFQDECYNKDSLYYVSHNVRIKSLKDTCFYRDPFELLDYVNDYLSGATISASYPAAYKFDVKKYFEKDTSYRFDWGKHITQISLFSTMHIEDLNKPKKYHPEYVSIDLTHHNASGITIRLGLVKWEDLKTLMLQDKRAWYVENNKKYNYIQDIESSRVLKLFEYFNNELK